MSTCRCQQTPRGEVSRYRRARFVYVTACPGRRDAPDRQIRRACAGACDRQAGGCDRLDFQRSGWVERGSQKSLHHRGTETQPTIGAVLGSLFFFIFSVSPCLYGENLHCLCLDISYSTMLAAIPAFSDSTLEECGMTTTSSISEIRSRGSPPPSLPMKMASWPVSFASERVMPLCDDVAISRRPRVRIAPSVACSFVRAMGTRNTDPADEIGRASCRERV